MAGTSLLALIDDIATLLDDVSVMTKVAAKKTAGVLGDDLALNAQQVTGVKADRELPVVWAVAKGSLLNKAILVPAALAIGTWLPWLVIVVLTIALPRLLLLRSPPATDEGYMAYFAMKAYLLLEGSGQLPGDGPLMLYPILLSWINGLQAESLPMLRLADLIVASVAGLLLLAMIARESGSRWWGPLLLGAPFLLPVIVAVLGLIAVFGRAGLLNRALETLGLPALSVLKSEEFAALILDLNLPDIDGISLLRKLRREGQTLPVLILTARDALDDRVLGLDAGSDDYMVKPFALQELNARLRALVRRSKGQAQAVLEYGDILIYPESQQVTYQGEAVKLTPHEYKLLQELISQSGRVLSRDQLQQSLYGWDEGAESNAVEVHIHHLRKKFFPELIRNIRGVGYIVPQPDTPGSRGMPAR